MYLRSYNLPHSIPVQNIETMLVKNFLLLSAALAVAVVSAADIDNKRTFLRHNKNAGRELKKDNKNNKNKNGGGDGISRTIIMPNFTDRNPTFNKFNGYIPQIGYTGKNGEVIPVGTSTTGNGEGTDNAVVNKTPNNGEATVNGQVNSIENDNDNGNNDNDNNNNGDNNNGDNNNGDNNNGDNDNDNDNDESGFDCLGDESGKCCTSHDECPNSGCCTGWYGCVDKGTAAYDLKCGAGNR